MYIISQFKDEVSGILSGLNLSNVTDLNGKLERAARTLVQKADIVEATGKQNYNIYDHVFDYAVPTTIFGGTVIDFRPQGTDRDTTDEVYKEYIEKFDQTKLFLPNGVQLTFEYRNGTGIMRVASARTTGRALLDPLNNTTGWTAAGSASGLTQDTIDYYESPASLRLLLTGASTGTLTKTIAAGDLTQYQGVGVVFLAIKIPSTASAATLLSSLAIRLGSSASAYTTVTATTGFLGAWSLGEWLLVALDLSTGVDTLTPNYTNITYLQIRITTTATITNFRVGGIWASLAKPYTLLFGSSAIFLPSGTTVPSLTISADTDSIMLNDAAYTLYQWEAAKEIAIGQGGNLAGSDIMMITDRLEKDLYPMYKGDNPSQEIRTMGNYYED